MAWNAPRAQTIQRAAASRLPKEQQAFRKQWYYSAANPWYRQPHAYPYTQTNLSLQLPLSEESIPKPTPYPTEPFIPANICMPTTGSTPTVSMEVIPDLPPSLAVKKMFETVERVIVPWYTYVKRYNQFNVHHVLKMKPFGFRLSFLAMGRINGIYAPSRLEEETMSYISIFFWCILWFSCHHSCWQG